MTRKVFLIPLLACVLSAPAAHSALLWTFDYGSNAAGVGFNDATHGTARRTALENAASQWGLLFGNTATITMTVTSSDDSTSGTLASASTAFADDDTPGFGLAEVVRNKVLTGTDLNGTDSDGEVDVNWGHDWGVSSSATGVGATEYDFYSTIFHELNHVLGFFSAIDQSGEDPTGREPGEAGTWSAFDQFVSDSGGTSIINSASKVLDGTKWGAASLGGTADGLFFNGANAVAANRGALVSLYSPAAWEGGSSGSHLDDDNAELEGLMMLAASDTGPYGRTLSAIEQGVFVIWGIR